MAEYYEKQTLLDFVKTYTPNFGGTTSLQCVERVIENAPAADVVEVVRGCWVITHDFDDNYEAMRPLGRVVRCSVCGYPTGHAKTHFCPYCGAKMDGRSD